MKFNLTIQEIYEKKVTVDAENWHEALMKAIKDSDRGKIILEDGDLVKCNVDVEGWPYQIFDKWTIEDVEKHVKESARWSELNLTENEMRQALYLMEKDYRTKGFSWEKLDKELTSVVNGRH